MERRKFIALALLLFTIPLSKNSTLNSWDIIKSTLAHIFPKYNNFSGANELELTQFLKMATNCKYFKKDDLKLLMDGAKKISLLHSDFISLNSEQKEKILREFEQNELGSNWLSLVMNYGIEGMLADPIYGGNNKELGWKAISHNTGHPRPKVRYGI